MRVKHSVLFIILAIFIPQLALAEMDESEIIQFQEDQRQQRIRDAQDDRDMFNFLTKSFGGSNYGSDYAHKYGCGQAKEMFFGADIKGCGKGQRNIGNSGHVGGNGNVYAKHGQRPKNLNQEYAQVKPLFVYAPMAATIIMPPETVTLIEAAPLLLNDVSNNPIILTMLPVKPAKTQIAHQASRKIKYVPGHYAQNNNQPLMLQQQPNGAYYRSNQAAPIWYAPPKRMVYNNPQNTNFRFRWNFR